MIIKNKIKFLIIFLIVYIVYLIHGLKNAGSNLLGVMFFEGFSAVIIKLILIVISCGLIYSILNILDLPIYDTWWTAETGMITIANFRCMPIKPGYLGKPVPGITITILDPDGGEVPQFTMGDVAINADCPCVAKGIWNNNLEDELDKRVIDKWNEIEDAISPKDRKNKYKRA